MTTTDLPELGPDGRARARALAALRLADVAPTSVVEFVSRGRCLVVGAEALIEVGGRVVALSTQPVSYTGEAKKAGKKVVGAAALGAGIGGMIDGGEGAAWGAGIGAVAGVAAAKSSPGNQVAVSAGTALEFRLARPLSVDVVV